MNTRPLPGFIPFFTAPVDTVDVAIAAVEIREGRSPLPCSERSQTAHVVARIRAAERQAELRRTGEPR